MSRWIHLNLEFKDYSNTAVKLHKGAIPFQRPSGLYKELISYLKNIIDVLSPTLINRYFYFFEPNPHLFLALEARNKNKINLIKRRINNIHKPNFIHSATLELSNDESNGETAIDFFHGGAKYALFRIGKGYRPVYEKNNETKLIHCFCNQLFFSINNEKEFYNKRISK